MKLFLPGFLYDRKKPTLLALFYAIFILFHYGCGLEENQEHTDFQTTILTLKQDTTTGNISVFRSDDLLVTQNAKSGHRPYLHPIKTPDGKSELTQYSPGHHKHQTGLYWGFTRVNGTRAPKDTLKKWFYNRNKPAHIKEQIGRDFFHFPGDSHWKKVSAEILIAEGEKVSWQTVYDMLDEEGNGILRETQVWDVKEEEGKLLLNLEWRGEGLVDVTINEFDYGGLFLRMPWKKGIEGEAVNAARQKNNRAEGQRAMWVDVGMEIEGQDEWGHITIFDHPENDGFPQTWRIDGQLGVGPVRARMGDWTINKGETKVFKHQLVAYTGELNDVALTDQWNAYIGSNSMYTTASLWGIAQEEGRNAKFLTPEEAVESMTIKEGFNVNAWAAEPMITQPMAFCWDDKGRMWIAENRDYESRGSGFANSGDSRILILEDTDRDGVADSRKVFLEGIPFPSAIAVGFDGLYLGAPPNFMFIPDKDGDDKADMEDIEILLTGWGILDRHETINSLHWGPDGWLYGLEGFATPSKIHKPDAETRLYKHKEEFPTDILEGEGVDINGGVWRYHPTKDIFEVVAHGFSNPWGIDYDAKGQLFISACVIPHMFHVIPGGIYHRQGGQHFNPYVYGDIRTIVDHRHRSAHGGARVYQSDAFPPAHHGRLFMANIHEHAVLSDILVPKGSGFIAQHGEDFMLANNAQWIGFSMEIGPEGGLYVLDWHDADICGKEVVHKETGRIFRVVPENSLAEEWEGRYDDLNEMNDVQLADLQTSKSDWHARRARIILQYRGSKGEISEDALVKLRDIFQHNKNGDYRLKAMWALHVSGGFAEQELLDALADEDEYIRGWAIQLLTEDRQVSSSTLSTFTSMAYKDPSPVVKLYLAAALQRLPEDQRWDMAENLMAQGDDAEDHNIPKMIWFAMESLIADQPNKGLALASNTEIPLLAEYTARRIVDADQVEKLVVTLGKKPKNLSFLLEGMRNGLEGRSDAEAPDNWASVYATLKSDKQVSALALEIAQQFGDAEAAKQYLATLKNSTAPIEERRTALEGLAQQQRKALIPLLEDLLDEPVLRLDAIRAIAAFDSYSLGRSLMDKYDTFNDAEKAETVQTLSTRTTYGRILTQALKDEHIPKRDIPAYVARQLRRVVGNGFVEVWGPIDQLSGNKAAAFGKYNRLLSDERMLSADVANGKALFQRTCSACHKMYGEGGIIGPDITGANRSNIDYLLSNMLDPSGDIQDDYKMSIITTRDGRTYSGNIAAENDRQVILRVVGQDEVVVNKSDIQSRETTAVSMMPEGLLQTLTDEEVVDLVGYLRVADS